MQILKESIREKIVKAAKKEFDLKGIKNTNMRQIAKDAGMTVGNLYRYFPSKDELVKAVTYPTYFKVNEIIKKYTGNQLSLDTKVSDFNIDIKYIKVVLNLMSEELVALYKSNTIEMRIMMKEEILNDNIKKWFTDLIHVVAIKWNGNDVNELLSEVLTHSVFEGVRYAFLHANDENELINAINTFLNMVLLSVAGIEEM